MKKEVNEMNAALMLANRARERRESQSAGLTQASMMPRSANQLVQASMMARATERERLGMTEARRD